MNEKESAPRVKHPGGRPKKLAARLAEQYGVSARVVKRIGVERFAAMSDDARRSRLSVSRAGFHGSRGGHLLCDAESEALALSDGFENAVRECGDYHGRAIADWMEEFGRSTFERVKQTAAAVIDESSDELISKVDRMVELARWVA
jgi:hypothetical protein